MNSPLLPFLSSRFRWKADAASQATGSRPCVVVAIEGNGRTVVWRFEDEEEDRPRRVCSTSAFSKYAEGFEGGGH
jgi:hypothetical protein